MKLASVSSLRTVRVSPESGGQSWRAVVAEERRYLEAQIASLKLQPAGEVSWEVQSGEVSVPGDVHYRFVLHHTRA